jgi:phosphoenolpyruvate carboxykinase (GTP)
MMRALKKKGFFPTLFTNTAIDLDKNEPWWEGLDGAVPSDVVDWQGKPWKPGVDGKAAHPNSRFTVSIYNAPTLSKEFDNPKGVPISAILFGGRRMHLIPLVTEAFNWQDGVFLGARTGSETTAAAQHQVGVLRRDPFSMLPFCGYNMADYFRHWLNTGKRLKHPPKIYSVNWFRVDQDGKFIWPGFGENIRVIKWIIERVHNEVGAKETPLGLVPHLKDLDLAGLNIPKEKMASLFEVHPAEWQGELADIKKYLSQFGDRLPKEMWDDYNTLAKRLGA